MDTEMSV